MSRPGKMPAWQKSFVITSMFTCSLSGCLYLIRHEFQFLKLILAGHIVLAFHGITAMLAILAFGSILPTHLKAGWKSKRKRLSGIGQIAFLSTLILSGALLYYGPGWIREVVVNVHWIIGVAFFVIFLIHYTSWWHQKIG